MQGFLQFVWAANILSDLILIKVYDYNICIPYSSVDGIDLHFCRKKKGETLFTIGSCRFVVQFIQLEWNRQDAFQRNNSEFHIVHVKFTLRYARRTEDLSQQHDWAHALEDIVNPVE